MKEYKFEIAKREFSVTVNKFAKQADGSAYIKYGDTHILATSVLGKDNTDFFPLIVNYEEKLYADGKIPGSFSKREAKPSEAATLAARLIDRPVRPLFNEKFMKEVQIVTSVLSLEKDCEPEVTAINAASISLMLAKNIPFEGPIGAVHVGYINGEYVINPTVSQRKDSELELRVAGTATEINMVEAKANELTEEVIVEAIMLAHDEIKKIVAFQKEILNDQAIEKDIYEYDINPEIQNYIEVLQKDLSDIQKLLVNKEKQQLTEDKKELFKKLAQENSITEENESNFKEAFEELFKGEFRKQIVNNKIRVDGRKIDEIRKLESEVGLLPRAHGSALFTRGETQSLASVTLANKSEAQKLDNFELEDEKPFMLHYNFPPFSVGEAGRMGAPGRREIGHGNLAEKALSIVMPSFEKFGYTIRIVSEILESNGSSSQASICAGSMALMQAGVPIKGNVAGIAMGLIGDSQNYTILTDIQGLEDHLGDMDFKVAGTKNGICAIQMDIKIKGISKEILNKSLKQAKVGRMEILSHMNKTIETPNLQLSDYAPKNVSFSIKPEKIKTVIGKGGETITRIIEQTGVTIDIEDTGLVLIYSSDSEQIEKARKIIQGLVKEYEQGQKYSGKISRVEAYGIFVKFEKNKEALIHISDLHTEKESTLQEKYKVGEDINFVIKQIDQKGRIKGVLNE